MKYKFVEIGCSIWNTYVDRFGLDVFGLLVEPLPNLFDAVPFSDTVKKEQVAISDRNGIVDIHIYGDYDPNKKYDYIDRTTAKYEEVGNSWSLASIKLNPSRSEELTGTVPVPIMTLANLFDKYSITEIDYFKVDAEGHDDIILKQLLSLMVAGKVRINKEIIFEYAYEMCNKPLLDKLSDIFVSKFGFKKFIDGADILLSKEDSLYGMKPNYTPRDNIDFWEDASFEYDMICQKEVYEYAKKIVDTYNLSKIVDFGCGSAGKLMLHFGDYDTIGIDLDFTVDVLKERYPDKTWLTGFPIIKDIDLFIASDVIEHMEDPDILLDYIENINAKHIILSTPYRDNVRHEFQNGPPEWPYHYREWTLSEFKEYIGSRFDIREQIVTNEEQRTQLIYISKM